MTKVSEKNKVAAIFITYFGTNAKYHKELAETIVDLISSEIKRAEEEGYQKGLADRDKHFKYGGKR